MNMGATAFPLRIFVADGDPDGHRVVERSNWVGNEYAHGSSRLHATVLATFEDVTDLANQLFGREANEGS